MAKNLAFAKPFGTDGGSSWADDDDLDLEPLVIAPPKVPTVAEKRQPEEEGSERRDLDRTDDRNQSPRGGNDRHYDDRRGGHDRHYDDRRGGNDRHYDDRRGGHDRHYDDHRGSGFRERDNFRSQHRGGRDGGDYAERPREHVERPKNPVPDHPPFKIFVGNLPFRTDEDNLADFFGQECIRDIRFPKDFETNRSKGFAYVEFDNRESLVRALELDGQDIDGRAVKIDVAIERNPRQDKTSGFFGNKRDGGRSFRNDGPQEEATAAKERPRLTLLPRNNASTEKSDGSKKASIFGDAKPRDESAYLERRKSELERKKSVDEVKPKAVEGETKHGPPSRKNSHDDGLGVRAGGRGAARGGRSERGRGERSLTRGDSRGRGDHAGGRGGRGQNAAPATKKEPEAAAAAPASRKSEPRPKRAEPVKTKIAAVAPAKVQNAFSALDLDSDSD